MMVWCWPSTTSSPNTLQDMISYIIAALCNHGIRVYRTDVLRCVCASKLSHIVLQRIVHIFVLIQEPRVRVLVRLILCSRINGSHAAFEILMLPIGLSNEINRVFL